MQTTQTLIPVTGELRRDFYDWLLFSEHWYSDFENENDEGVGSAGHQRLRALIMEDAPYIDLAAPVVADYWAEFVAWRATI